MESKIIEIRNWIRTNGVMSEDGKNITYNCIEIEEVIKKALLQTDVSKCVYCENKPYKKGAAYCERHMASDDYS